MIVTGVFWEILLPDKITYVYIYEMDMSPYTMLGRRILSKQQPSARLPQVTIIINIPVYVIIEISTQ